MAWIESHQALGHHPKTIALARCLKCSLPTAVGYLQYLWWWALDYAPDGLVKADDRTVVARACEFHGHPEKFLGGLLEAGFVDLAEGGALRIHDWRIYAGRLIETRKKDAERKRLARTVSGDMSAGHPATSPQDVRRTGHNQPDQPPVGPRVALPVSRARAPDDAPRRRAADSQAEDEEPPSLRPTQQQCPLCPDVFSDSAALRDHVDNSPRHKIRPEPETFRGGRRRHLTDEPIPAEVLAELADMASRPSAADRAAAREQPVNSDG